MDIASTIERAVFSKMDTEAYFNEVYTQTSPALLRLIIIKTSDSDSVEDILQSVYQEFFLRITKKGFTDIQSPKGLLYKMARQALARHYKRRRIKKETELDLSVYGENIPDEGIPFESILSTREEMGKITDIIKMLPLLSYKAFALYYFYDMPVASIAGHLGISASNVKDRLWRARNAIRKELVTHYEQ